MSGSASAAPVVLQPVGAAAQDAFVYEAYPDFDFKGGGYAPWIVAAKSTERHELRGLIRFDLNGLTLEANEKATLNLYVADTAVLRMFGTSPTPESPAVLQVAPASEAWNPAHAGWNATIANTETFTSLSVNGVNRWISLDITSLIRQWLDEPATNYGMVLSQEAAVNHNGWVGLTFHSGANDTNQPFLQIATVPEPTALGAMAALLLIARRNRKGS